MRGTQMGNTAWLIDGLEVHLGGVDQLIMGVGSCLRWVTAFDASRLARNHARKDRRHLCSGPVLSERRSVREDSQCRGDAPWVAYVLL